MTASALDKATQFCFRLDAHSGVPVYRQLIDQVLAAVARGALRTGDQLPTVRQVAVDLTINPNTVLRAYREMEIRKILDTQQGSGTFVAEQKATESSEERARQLEQLVQEFVARAGSLGFTAQELVRQLRDTEGKTGSRRK
jgi:GntR family transcriptional regulator